MTMKKSLIAVAVAGAVGAPMSAAQAAEAYGFVFVSLDSVSKDDGGVGSLIFSPGNDGSLHLDDTAETRFGFTGDEDLGNGLTAGYQFEFGIGTASSTTAGAPNEDATATTRLANVSLSGDFGTVKAGTQWGVLYEYLGWNVYRTAGHGGAAWYYSTIGTANTMGNITGGGITNDAYGLRVSNAVTYTYGAGGYGSDPFTFSVQGMMDPDSGTGAAENDEAIDALAIGAQGVFGDITVNGVSYSESDSADGAAEPSVTGIGVNWDSGPIYVGGNFIVSDLDDGGDDLETLNVLASYDMGGGLTGFAGLGSGDSGDRNNDLSSVFLGLQRSLSSSTTLHLEIESATVDNAGATGDDAETTVISAALQQAF